MVATRRPAPFQKAQREAAVNAKVVQRHINKVWNSASFAPIFRKEVAKKDKNGNDVIQRRSVRLIQGHAYNIACAGAVKNAVREVKQDCDTWGIDYKSSTNSPFMLGMPKGTKLMLEQFLAAYVGTAVLKANRMMQAAGKHKRLQKSYIARAFNQVNDAVHCNSGTSRTSVIVPLKVKKAAASGADYQPPADGDVEEAADEAAAGEEVDE